MEILRASVLRVFDFEFDILRSLGMIFIKRDLTNSKNENLPILKIVLHKISIVERMTSPPPHRPLWSQLPGHILGGIIRDLIYSGVKKLLQVTASILKLTCCYLLAITTKDKNRKINKNEVYSNIKNPNQFLRFILAFCVIK